MLAKAHFELGNAFLLGLNHPSQVDKHRLCGRGTREAASAGDQALGGLIALYDPLTARLMAQREAGQQRAGIYTLSQWLAGEEKAGDSERNPS